MQEWAGVHNPHQALERMTILAYGSSGAGKTVFGSTWPRPVFIDLENGMGSVRRPVGRFPKPGAQITTIAQVLQFIDLLAFEEHEFRTVVVDGLNELQYLCMRRVITQYNKNRPYDDQPTLADFGKSLNDLESIVRKILALPMNVVLTCQATDRVNETDLVAPMLVGRNIAKVFTRLVDMVGYMSVQRDEKGDVRHQMWFHQPMYVTKDRTGMLPPVLEDPSWGQIVAHYDSLVEADVIE